LFAVFRLQRQARTVRSEHFEYPVGHDAVSQVIGVHTIPVDEPVGVAVSRKKIDEEAVVSRRHVPDGVVVPVEQFETPMLKADPDREIIHVVGAG